MTLQEANQQLMGDFKRVMRDAEERFKTAAGEVGEKVKKMRSRLATALESARAMCARLQDKTVECGRDAGACR